jgi:hypothetical protein
VLPATTIPCRVLIWQYAGDCNGNGGFDCNQTNPSINLQADLLNFLILPPDVTAIIT